MFMTFFFFCKSESTVDKAVLEPWVSPAFAITYLCNHCNIRFDPISVKVRKRSLTPDDLWPKGCWLLSVTYVTLPKDHCVQVPWKYINVCGYSNPFCKNLNRRSLTPRWPLTPHLLRSHVWLYPRIIVSKSYENKSKYVDTVTLFAKTWTKGHWPLNDLWPHICCGHMCDFTQGSSCPSPMKIHQSMWIQWPFLQKTWTKGHWPLDDLWPHICWGHMCHFTQG